MGDIEEVRKYPSRKGKEIRIVRVSPMMKQHVSNIAANIGVSETDFLKGALLEIIKTYPPEYLKHTER